MILINLSRINRAAVRALGIAVAAAAVAGCGFHLQGTGSMPGQMTRTYLRTADPTSEFLYSLREALRLRGLEVVETPEQAGAEVVISEDSSGERVLSVSARNIPREYEVFYAVTFAVESDDTQLLEPESLIVTRSYTYDETQVLGKREEERVLRRALAEDLARRVVRRIEALAPGGQTPTS